MIDHLIGFYLILLIFLASLYIASVFIPYYGFIRKRWKGLALGCLLQPFIFALALLLVVGVIFVYQQYDINKYRKAAMVTVRIVEDDVHSNYWYLNPNEVCFYEHVDENKKSSIIDYRQLRLYDVIPSDSFRVCVDDKINVKFDLKENKVTATEYDEPIEVVSVDWDKVNKYFEKQSK